MPHMGSFCSKPPVGFMLDDLGAKLLKFVLTQSLKLSYQSLAQEGKYVNMFFLFLSGVFCRYDDSPVDFGVYNR